MSHRQYLHMRKFFFQLVISLLFVFTVSGQSLKKFTIGSEVTNPAEQGFSVERLARIDKVMQG